MSKSKKSAKKPAAYAAQTATSKSTNEGHGAAPKPILRAIRVTPELLAAAKAYKKATGKSFYALGLEAIAERLAREGYIKDATKA